MWPLMSGVTRGLIQGGELSWRGPICHRLVFYN